MSETNDKLLISRIVQKCICAVVHIKEFDYEQIDPNEEFDLTSMERLQLYVEVERYTGREIDNAEMQNIVNITQLEQWLLKNI